MDIQRLLIKAIIGAVFGFLFLKVYQAVQPKQRQIGGFHMLDPGPMYWQGLLVSCLLSSFLWILFYNGFKKEGASFFDLRDSNSVWFFVILAFSNLGLLLFSWYILKIYNQALGWRDKKICYKKDGRIVEQFIDSIELRSFSSRSPSKLFLKNGDVVALDEYLRGFDSFFDHLLENHLELKRTLAENL